MCTPSWVNIAVHGLLWWQRGPICQAIRKTSLHFWRNPRSLQKVICINKADKPQIVHDLRCCKATQAVCKAWLQRFWDETPLCGPILPVIKNMLDRKQEQHKDMVSALQWMVDLIQPFDRLGNFPSSKEYMQARNLEKRFFAHYDSLNICAQENDRLLFHLVMKHHTLHQLVTYLISQLDF